MKQDKHRFLRKRPGRKPGKAGSSLALVMMIGAALVIWVMCIMPLMTTTGTTAIQTEEKYDDYLESRSSIEYCKSELENIVKSEIPYNFCVIKDPANNDKFKAIRRNKKANGLLDDSPNGYTTFVNVPAPLDATQDKPQSGDNGNKVTAICVVVPDPAAPSQYIITITTYHNGEKGQTYSLIYTLSGSLLIYPESYKRNQALPLSDFVVVDGIMGGKYNEAGELVANKIWKSTINMGNAVSDSGTGNFEEWLLPWVKPDDMESGYADSLEYPAVFKKTAQAWKLSDGETVGTAGTPLTNGDFTSNETWIEPTAVEADNSTNCAPGSIWIVTEDNFIKVKLYTDMAVDITARCTIYLNGEVNSGNSVPDHDGTYCVTVDFEGGDCVKKDSTTVKVLPVSGLRMLDPVGTVATHQQNTPQSSVEKITPVTVDGVTTYTVELKNAGNGVRYGYCSDNPDDIVWSDENIIKGLEGGKTYYFYIYLPATIEKDNGGYYIYKSDSDVKYVGMIFPKKFVSANELADGDRYLVLGKNNNNYYAMTSTASGNNNLAASQITVSGDFVISGSNIDAWTAQYNSDNSKWSFCYDTSEEQSFITMSSYWHLFVGTTYMLATGSIGNNYFTVNSKEDGVQIIKESQYGSYDRIYLKFNNNNNPQFSASDSQSTVYFMSVPAEPPEVLIPSVTCSLDSNKMEYGHNAKSFIKNHATLIMEDGSHKKIDNEDGITLYANGIERAGGGEWLNAGKYNLITKITVDGETYCFNLGNLTVSKSALPESSPTIQSFAKSGSDELAVMVTANGWHIDNTNQKYIGGTRWFGYKKVGEDRFHWYPAGALATDAVPADSQSYTFRLPYGEYNFAVMECGDNDHTGIQSAPNYYKISPIPVTLTQEQNIEYIFTYTVDSEGTCHTTWYERTGENKYPVGKAGDGTYVNILPMRVKLVFGTYHEDTKTTTWSYEYSAEASYYGAVIEGSNLNGLPELSDETVLKGVQRINVTNNAGHTSSMMRGSSLYFMGQGASINTYGNSVFLTTDLLVLSHDIVGGGSVDVAPYSTGEKSTGNTLLFAVNDIKIGDTAVFKEKTFYIIPKDTNIAGLSAGSVANLISYHIDETDKTIPTEVQYFFRQDVYPELNLDVAYANDVQLAHIVSGETIEWTENGVLSGKDNTNNNAAKTKATSYAVCAYVNLIDSGVSRKANRVLIAARTFDGHDVLEVNNNLTFTTRYLSIHADQVKQGSSGTEFRVKNLGQDQDLLSWLGSFLGVTKYHSKTLQVDYERNTDIVYSDNSTLNVPKQICRYDDGANLFTADAQPLMASYDAEEINQYYNFFENREFTNTVQTVDRYVTITDSKKSGINITPKLVHNNSKLKIYANYICFNKDITTITLYNGYTLFGESVCDILINSQEKGYWDKEYLGLFTDSSAEGYMGTIVYFANNVNVTYERGKSGTIQKGFYYIYPKGKNETATSLKELVTNLGNGPDETTKKPYKIAEAELYKYSIIIDQGTGLPNKGAYIDTGLFDNTSTGLGGFSGGNVG